MKAITLVILFALVAGCAGNRSAAPPHSVSTTTSPEKIVPLSTNVQIASDVLPAEVEFVQRALAGQKLEHEQSGDMTIESIDSIYKEHRIDGEYLVATRLNRGWEFKRNSDGQWQVSKQFGIF